MNCSQPSFFFQLAFPHETCPIFTPDVATERQQQKTEDTEYFLPAEVNIIQPDSRMWQFSLKFWISRWVLPGCVALFESVAASVPPPRVPPREERKKTLTAPTVVVKNIIIPPAQRALQVFHKGHVDVSVCVPDLRGPVVDSRFLRSRFWNGSRGRRLLQCALSVAGERRRSSTCHGIVDRRKHAAFGQRIKGRKFQLFRYIICDDAGQKKVPNMDYYFFQKAGTGQTEANQSTKNTPSFFS